MSSSGATWLLGHPGAGTEYSELQRCLLEAAYIRWWQQGEKAPSEVQVPAAVDGAPAGIVAFHLMEHRFTPEHPGPGNDHSEIPATCPVWRATSPPQAMVASQNTLAAEWGFGQDPVNGMLGFVAYDSEVNSMLEEAYTKWKCGGKGKGIMFVAANGADYLVDFEKMQQLRMATRRVRPVYRHGISAHGRTAGASPEELVATVDSQERSVGASASEGSLVSTDDEGGTESWTMKRHAEVKPSTELVVFGELYTTDKRSEAPTQHAVKATVRIALHSSKDAALFLPAIGTPPNSQSGQLPSAHSPTGESHSRHAKRQQRTSSQDSGCCFPIWRTSRCRA